MGFLPAISPFQLLGQSNLLVANTGNTTENILATVNIPAGCMGANGILVVTHAWTYTNSANNKTPRVRLGGIGGAILFAGIVTTSADALWQTWIRNNNAANVQKALNSGVTSSFTITSGALSTGAIDTTAAQTLVFTAQCANAGETINLEGFTVQLITA